MARKAWAGALTGAVGAVWVVISATGHAQITREGDPPAAEPARGETGYPPVALEWPFDEVFEEMSARTGAFPVGSRPGPQVRNMYTP